jgi:hypothetical protein
MRLRSRIYILMLGTAAALIFVLVGSRRLGAPLTVEMVGLTNLPPTVPALSLWTAQNAQGEVSGLMPASPSHVLFKISNRTAGFLPFRPLLYQFADSLPAGVALPAGPSRHRGGRGNQLPVELNGYKSMTFGPMAFGPPERDCFTLRTLAPNETALIALPRPPFECVWRAAIAYELLLTRPETLKYIIKKRLHIPEVHNIIGAPQAFAYDECIYGVWITNTVLNQRASRSAHETNKTSSAAGSRR